MIGRRPWGRRAPAVVALGVAAAVLAAPLFREPPAPAAMFPSDGAVLGAAPGVVRIGLPGPARADVHVAVTDERGATVTDGPVGVDGTAVRQPLRALSPGGYRVTYHVALVDGGQLTGATVFRVGGPAAGQEPPVAAPSVGGHRHGGAVDPLTGAVLAANAPVALGIAGAEGRRRWRRRRLDTGAG